MQRKLTLAGATLAALLTLAAPAPAPAAPTATFANGTLTVTGEGEDEVLTVEQAETRVLVSGPSGMNDPDAAGPICGTLAFSSTVFCRDTDVTGVIVQGGAGRDTIEDRRPNTTDVTTLDGGTGDDRLTAPIGAARHLALRGGDGADRLTRNTVAGSAVLMLAGPGDDVLEAGAGTLGPRDDGGEGDDIFNGSSQHADSLLAGPGADTYNGGTRTRAPGEVVAEPATYQLIYAADTITYGAAVVSPLVVSLDGRANDGAGNEGDNVMADVERVDGGSGDDVLMAGVHPAGLLGGAGDDRLVGSSGDDNLHGRDGSDVLIARAGDDILHDGDQTPVVLDPTLPAAGNDRLDGGPGDDTFNSDRGADELTGGAGYDRAGFDRVIPKPPTTPTRPLPAPFEISLDDRANDGRRGAAEGDNVHSDIEEVATGNGSDVLVGSSGPDLLFSSGGNDRIVPGAGVDAVFAGGGDDSISAVDQASDRVDCERGNDRVDADLPGEQPERADVTFNCEAISGVPFGPPNPRATTDRTPPRVSGLRAVRPRFAVGRRNTARNAARRKRGTTLVFRLSEDAAVTISIARQLAGRRRGRRCRPLGNRTGRKCTRLIKAATLRRAQAPAGRNRIVYSGRIRGRALRPGRYRATVRAVDAAGNRSAPSSVNLTVVRP